MSYNDTESQRTNRVIWLCATLGFLGVLFFFFKVNACSLACQSCNRHEFCHDEFLPDSDYNKTCPAGSRAEIVKSAEHRGGILCHCINPAAPPPTDSAWSSPDNYTK